MPLARVGLQMGLAAAQLLQLGAQLLQPAVGLPARGPAAEAALEALAPMVI